MTDQPSKGKSGSGGLLIGVGAAAAIAVIVGFVLFSGMLDKGTETANTETQPLAAASSSDAETTPPLFETQLSMTRTSDIRGSEDAEFVISGAGELDIRLPPQTELLFLVREPIAAGQTSTMEMNVEGFSGGSVQMAIFRHCGGNPGEGGFKTIEGDGPYNWSHTFEYDHECFRFQMKNASENEVSFTVKQAELTVKE